MSNIKNIFSIFAIISAMPVIAFAETNTAFKPYIGYGQDYMSSLNLGDDINADGVKLTNIALGVRLKTVGFEFNRKDISSDITVDYASGHKGAGNADISYDTLNFLLYLPKISINNFTFDTFFKVGAGGYNSNYHDSYSSNDHRIFGVNIASGDENTTNTSTFTNNYTGSGTIAHTSFNVEKTIKTVANKKLEDINLRLSIYRDTVIDSTTSNGDSSDKFKNISWFEISLLAEFGGW